MRRLTTILFVLFTGCLAAGCRGGRRAEKTPTGPEGPVTQNKARPGADELWALAPAEANAGLVLADGAGAALRDVATRWMHLAEMHPVGKPLIEKLRGELAEEEANPFDEAKFRTATGLDLGKGAAVFGVFEDGDEPKALLLVVPVADRATWRNFSKAKSEELGDLDADRLDEMLCAEVGKRYLCAPEEKTLRAALAGGSSSPLGERAKGLPARERGDVEALMNFAGVNLSEWEQIPFFSAPKTLFATLRLDERGGTLSAWLDAEPKGPGKEHIASKPSKDVLALSKGALGFGRVVVPMKAILPLLPPSLPVAPDVDARRDIIEELTGESAWLTRGKADGVGALMLFLRHGKHVAAALQKVCDPKVLPMQVSWSSADKTCTLSLPVQPNNVRARVDGERLVIALGTEPKALSGEPASAWAGHADARAVFEGASTLAFWGVGLDPLQAMPQGMFATLTEQMPDKAKVVLPYIELGSFLGASIYEMALTAGLYDDGLRLSFRVTTFADEGKEALAAHEAALAKRASGDTAGYREAMAAAGKAHGKTLLAKQAKLLVADAPAFGVPSALFVGVTAGLAIPTYMKYIRKSKTTEAVFFVKRIYDGARAYYEENKKFPKSGTSQPPGSCCKFAGGKCVPDAKIWEASPWKELMFSMDDPHFFTYEFVSEATGFTARALGDLDCDGEYSTYEMVGKLDSDGNLSGSAGIFKDKELE
ncbi:MAG: hypothetical protein HY698_07720 [Deltaproteobacteria bacterium]|nr:hypothetical protein [Deltaproteobacteria bacterium]